MLALVATLRVFPFALIVFATLAAALADNVQTGVLWIYPAALLFHFIIERRLANIFNGSVVVMTGFFAYAEPGPALTLRMAAALTLTILVANVYSYASEIEQQQTMRQSQRADLLVRATMAGLLEWNVTTSTVTYSERYKELLGYPADFGTAGWSDWFEMIDPEDREMARGVLQQQLRGHSAPHAVSRHSPLDLRLLHADEIGRAHV